MILDTEARADPAVDSAGDPVPAGDTGGVRSAGDHAAVAPGDDVVFKALADAGRRALLDALFEREGQSVNELCLVLPEMTRFGVMKHLGVLEAAHLVLAERDGRRKRHYLNAVPIRRIHDRWINRYTAVAAAGLIELADGLESA